MKKKNNKLVLLIIILFIVFLGMIYFYLNPVEEASSGETSESIKQSVSEIGTIEKTITGSRRNTGK